MAEKQSSKSDPSPAWFVAGESGAEEDFFPEQPAQACQPVPTLVLEPTPAPEASNATAPAEPHLEPGAVAALAGVDPHRSEPAPMPEQRAFPSPGEPSRLPPQTEGTGVAPVETVGGEEASLAPVSPPAQAVSASPDPGRLLPGAGFREAEAIRVGGPATAVPTDRAGLFVIVRTPQQVRLGQIVPLKAARTIIGRGRAAACFLDDPGVAEIHIVVTHQLGVEEPGFFLHTARSTPVRLNGAIAGEVTRLQSADRIELGSTEVVFFEADLRRGSK